MSTNDIIELSFKDGSLILEGSSCHQIVEDFPQLVFDRRTSQFRVSAHCYRDLVLWLRENKIEYKDLARKYGEVSCSIKEPITPRLHQEKALAAWIKAGKRGVVSLPTGAGKTILAILCLAQIQRSTLVLVPTLDLLSQWQETLSKYLKIEIGTIGGGEKNIKPITVSTYDSARLMMEYIGDQFGFLIFDECHHLPAPFYQQIAYAAMAPFRLGLSATVERLDGGEQVLDELIGKLVFHEEIRDLVSEVLAPYDVVQICVDLTEKERVQYDTARSTYIEFIRQQRINFRQADGWKQFIIRASRSDEGKKAFRAYREQKNLAQAAGAKLDEIWNLLNTHSGEQTIIFTDDNNMAYRIGKNFILPVLTHKTKTKERQ